MEMGLTVVNNRLGSVNTLSGATREKYMYLLNSVLCTHYNRNTFSARVKEVYFEFLMQHCEYDEIPHINQIASIIDEENKYIITDFFTGFDYSENDIDSILMVYEDDVACELDTCIEDVLICMGMTFRGSPFAIISTNRCVGDVNPAQNILLGRFL